MIDDDTVDTIELLVQQYEASVLADFDDLPATQVRTLVLYRLESLAYQLTMVMRLPAQVLQHDRILAEYPVTWWDHIKQRLGWRHAVSQVRLTEHLLYPHIAVPRHESKVRLYTSSRLTQVPSSGEQE